MHFALFKNERGIICGSVTGFRETLKQMEFEY
jgi:hypothetical protein